MRGHKVPIALSALVAIAGIVLITDGTVAGGTAAYRAGLPILILGLAGVIDARSRRDRDKVIAHQRLMAQTSMQERQQYATLGWKAAKLDALNGAHSDEPGDAVIVQLPVARTGQGMRRDGSA